MPINSRSILVVGGAGYIGSHMVLLLQEAGYEPVVLDNLSKGHRDAVMNAPLHVADMGDTKAVSTLFAHYDFAAVMHFAGFIEVAESMQNPLIYYQNNVAATLNLLQVMLHHQVKHLIFSSTAAVYGHPQVDYIDESHPIAPINSYGKSKWMVEQIIQDLATRSDLHYAILRYFNAAGADPAGRVGERHQHESHLIPLLLQTALGLAKQFTLYGNDYPTPDGTCIRDFVHVEDICRAHLLALEALLQGEKHILCNLGTGQGHSVLEVIAAVQRVLAIQIPLCYSEARQGDPAILVANADLADAILNWQPRYHLLDTLIEHTWQFMLKTHKGNIKERENGKPKSVAND